MKVRIVIGTSAYAHIQDTGYSMDVLLNPGRSAQRSLRETADELAREADRLQTKIGRLQAAAAWLDADAVSKAQS